MNSANLIEQRNESIPLLPVKKTPTQEIPHSTQSYHDINNRATFLKVSGIAIALFGALVIASIGSIAVYSGSIIYPNQFRLSAREFAVSLSPGLIAGCIVACCVVPSFFIAFDLLYGAGMQEEKLAWIARGAEIYAAEESLSEQEKILPLIIEAHEEINGTGIKNENKKLKELQTYIMQISHNKKLTLSNEC